MSLSKICDALKYPNGQGVVHRDLKLENSMVDGEEERIKILDFSNASRVDRIRVRSGKSSHPMGTPEGQPSVGVRVMDSVRKRLRVAR